MKAHICRACGKPIDEYALNINLCLGCGDNEEEVHHGIIEELRTEARHSEMIAVAKSVGSIQPEPKWSIEIVPAVDDAGKECFAWTVGEHGGYARTIQDAANDAAKFI